MARMARAANDKLDLIVREVDDLHPLLNALLPKLPRVRDVEYHHGAGEMGADFVVSRTNDTFGTIEHIGVIAKVGKIVQDLGDIQRQIDECELPRLIRGGKNKIRITEIWVVITKHITQGAKEKIYHKYNTRKIEFIDGAALEKLVDQYTPLAWSRLPIAVGEYPGPAGTCSIARRTGRWGVSPSERKSRPTEARLRVTPQCCRIRSRTIARVQRANSNCNCRTCGRERKSKTKA